MKSPFPGMDPYLEGRWQDVHHRICTYACDLLQEQLGGDLVARLGERLIVESLFDQTRSIYPDVRIVEHGLGGRRLSAAAAGFATALAEPPVVQVSSDPEPQGFIEIIEPDNGTLVSVIQFISPSNKMSADGSRQYEAKQRELDAAQISVVEIDLIRAGERCFMLPQAQLPAHRGCAYFACVFRGYQPGKFEVYAMPLQARLPVISIPLRRSDQDVALDIQQLIDQAYRNGRYDLTDYRMPCIPPLEGDDAIWADKLLRGAGRR